MNIAIQLRTIARLGPTNVARVAAYRLGLKTGLGRVRRLKAQTPRGPFFPTYDGPARTWPVRQAWRREATYFSWLSVPFDGGRPDWFLNPLTGARIGAERPWWEISDFDAASGDIKIIWEPSRFDWVLSMAQGVASCESGEAARLEDWLGDWCRRNPPYLGPNWKCGQETSIRVMHLAMASLILGQGGRRSRACVTCCGCISRELRRPSATPSGRTTTTAHRRRQRFSSAAAGSMLRAMPMVRAGRILVALSWRTASPAWSRRTAASRSIRSSIIGFSSIR